MASRHRRLTGAVLVTVALAACSSGTDVPRRAASTTTSAQTAQPANPRCPWVGSHAPIEDRVDQVVARLTAAEKLSMVHGVDSDGLYAGATAPVERLCIPGLHLADGPGGVRMAATATGLPAPISLAASWDRRRAGEYGDVLGSEMRTTGASVALGPTVNMVRDPRWGRAFESFGEDPYLAAELAVPEITAIQAHDVIAQVKHFAVYNQERYRASAADNAVVDDRTLHELYLPAFEAAVERAKVGSVMCGYNSVNGAPACTHRQLLQGILKRDWGFDGFVTSDWWTLLGGPNAARDGLDMQMPHGCFLGSQLAKAIEAGDIPASRLDDMVRRILRPMFRFGVVDHPPTGTPDAPAATAAHRKVAAASAAAGMVLLKNEGALPIDERHVRKIAVIGRAAKDFFAAAGGGSANTRGTDVINPFQGITDRAGARTDVVYDPGADAAKAAEVAAGADIAIVVTGRTDTESHDHATIDLDAASHAVIPAVAASQPNTVVVLNTGSPVAMPWLADVKSVVEAWYPGEAGGTALAQVLFGDVNPSGKLPVSFPKAIADLPASTPQQWGGTNGRVEYSEGLLTGYRWYAAKGIEPEFAFGHGLSYTEFSYDRLRVTPGPAGRATVTARITNTGARAGSEVAQLYVRQPDAAGEPPLLLKGFERVHLGAGRSATVRFHLDARAFSHWDTAGRRWVASAGRYRVLVGGASDDLPLEGSLRLGHTIRGAKAGPVLDSPPPQPQRAAVQACSADDGVPIATSKMTDPITP